MCQPHVADCAADTTSAMVWLETPGSELSTNGMSRHTTIGAPDPKEAVVKPSAEDSIDVPTGIPVHDSNDAAIETSCKPLLEAPLDSTTTALNKALAKCPINNPTNAPVHPPVNESLHDLVGAPPSLEKEQRLP